MKRILRWIRGALGNAVAWGCVWAGFGLLIGAISSITRPSMLPLLPGIAIVVGAIGAFFGGSFAAFISVNFRGRSVDELSPARFALGGALVTIPFTLPLNAYVQSWKGWIFFSDMIVPVAVPAVLGGLTAYSTVKLAQRTVPDLRPMDRLEPGVETLLSRKRMLRLTDAEELRRAAWAIQHRQGLDVPECGTASKGKRPASTEPGAGSRPLEGSLLR